MKNKKKKKHKKKNEPIDEIDCKNINNFFRCNFT